MMMEERGGRRGGEPVKVFALDRSTTVYPQPAGGKAECVGGFSHPVTGWVLEFQEVIKTSNVGFPPSPSILEMRPGEK